MQPSQLQKYEMHFDKFLQKSEGYCLAWNIYTKLSIVWLHYSKEFLLNWCKNKHQFWSSRVNNCNNKISHKKFDIFRIRLMDCTNLLRKVHWKSLRISQTFWRMREEKILQQHCPNDLWWVCSKVLYNVFYEWRF